jgi:adenosylhomocysteine nucleosidase
MPCAALFFGFKPMGTPMPKVAMVAALEREVWLLVKDWRVSQRDFESRRFKFFENEDTVVVCGGIGAEAARRACEAVITMFHPEVVISVGYAGALAPALKVGQVFVPRVVVDAGDGSRVETATAGEGVLVSCSSVAGVEQKGALANTYGAQAVDMEAAAVARGAQTHGIAFLAVKAVSDEMDFSMPPTDRFVRHDGQFQTARFAAFAVLRPWLWPGLLQLSRNSKRATEALCVRLRQYSQPAAACNPELALG